MKRNSSTRPVVVVSGGAGYLGRCTMDVLWDQGFAPICLDNYSVGQRFKSKTIPAFRVNLADAAATARVWKKLPPVSAILHFAAFALVRESNEKPGDYFRNNLLCTVTLAEQAARANIPFVHSSSCTVYGTPRQVPILETSILDPISPYGESKRCAEHILKAFCTAQKLRVLNLRYFNPAGSLPALEHGECHEPETHLVPNVIRRGLRGEPVHVFGTDYPTTDGSCIRDFIHVQDLALGHVQAIHCVSRQAPGYCDAVNLGSGKGSSVLEVIAAAEKVLGKKIAVERKPRRPGDPAALVASTEKARSVLGWTPTKSLEEILRSHLEWEKKREYAMKTVQRRKVKKNGKKPR